MLRDNVVSQKDVHGVLLQAVRERVEYRRMLVEAPCASPSASRFDAPLARYTPRASAPPLPPVAATAFPATSLACSLTFLCASEPPYWSAIWSPRCYTRPLVPTRSGCHSRVWPNSSHP